MAAQWSEWQDETDSDLVARALTDSAAFATLYSRYIDQIYRFCLRRLGTVPDAEDATSVVFTKAFTALADVRRGSFRAWLFAIAHHTTLDAIRRRHPTTALDAAGTIPDASPSPEELALVSAGRYELRQALLSLTADQRRVVELRLSGLTGIEIAAVLGKPRNAIDALQFRALARLRLSYPTFTEGAQDDD